MNCGIYNIISKIDNKLYIGYATNIKKRWSKHKSDLKSKCHKNKHLQSAWNKYGKDNFKFERIEVCEKSILPSREHYWCGLLNVHDDRYGYNIEPTSDDAYHPRAQETIDKVRIANTGKKRTAETCRKLSELHKGRKQSPEIVEKRAAANRGLKKGNRSTEQRENMSIGQSKRPILQLDVEGNFIAEWRSSEYAARMLGFIRSGIDRVCKGESKQHKGYIWKYKDENLRKEKYKPYRSKRKNPLKTLEELKSTRYRNRKEYLDKYPEKKEEYEKRAYEKYKKKRLGLPDKRRTDGKRNWSELAPMISQWIIEGVSIEDVMIRLNVSTKKQLSHQLTRYRKKGFDIPHFPVWWERPDKIERLASKTPEEYKRLHRLASKKSDRKRIIVKKINKIGEDIWLKTAKEEDIILWNEYKLKHNYQEQESIEKL